MASTDLVDYKPITDWSDRESYIDKRGYRRIWIPEHPKSFRGGWYYEHRLVAEKMAGEILPSYYTVHHISRNKSDNSEYNLFVCREKEHMKATKAEQH